MDIKEFVAKFDGIYKSVIVPKLSPLEKFRKEELKKARSILSILFASRRRAVADEYKLTIKNNLFRIILSVFAKINPQADTVDMDEVMELGFCANANSAVYGIASAILYKNSSINFTEAKIERLSNDDENQHAYALFNGLMVRMETEKNLNFKTIISRKAKDFSTNERKNVYLGSKVNFRYNNTEKLETVKFEESEFGKMFDIFSNDETKARKILTDKLIEKIKLLRDAFSSSGISLAIVNSGIYIFIEEDEFFFEKFDLNKDISDKEELKKVFIKTAYLFNLINHFS